MIEHPSGHGYVFGKTGDRNSQLAMDNFIQHGNKDSIIRIN